jgi:glycosyl-4,4'-diaponeurosporenoate acyltransferase
LFRIRGFETGGRFYERWLKIKRWKDRLPEAGAIFRGGVSKRHVGAADRASLEWFGSRRVGPS